MWEGNSDVKINLNATFEDSVVDGNSLGVQVCVPILCAVYEPCLATEMSMGRHIISLILMHTVLHTSTTGPDSGAEHWTNI